MTYSFSFTPENAWPIASAIADDLVSKGYLVHPESLFLPDAPYKTSIIATRKNAATILVEAQDAPEYHKTLQEFVLWLRAKRYNVEIFLGTGMNSKLSIKTLSLLKEDGVGIIFVEGSTINIHDPALNPANTVTISPDLRFGQYKEAVEAAITKFNKTDRKSGLRDMCDIVEGATRRLIKKAIVKGWMNGIPTLAAGEWADCINRLASIAQYTGGRIPLVSESLKIDLHSFRGVRNLVDHPAQGVREERRIALQFTERMAMGPRLVAELATLSRRVI